jgi:hypothetical protein
MILPAASDRGTSLMMVEGGLTLVAIAVSFCWPRFGAGYFLRIERAFGRLAQKQGSAVTAVGAIAFLLRLAILPLCPVPLPFVPDDFSFLLAADTFASGRLANPTPAMWVHFESIHISMKPTYMSMYFPAQGLLLAAGKVLFGHPWYGLLCASALMCAAICWMLQAWLPPTWALLGGMLAVLHLGLFSYWINTYHAAGSIVALGGALVLGALPRFMKTARLRYSLLLAVGVALLAITRPFEGILLCLPVAVMLGCWMFSGKNRPSTAVLIQRTVVPLALIVAAGAWLAYYDYRAFGSPLTLPYTINRNMYAMAPYFVWQSQRPEPVYRHEVIRQFYYDGELRGFDKFRTLSGFISESLLKATRGVLFFSGIALLPPLIMLRRVLMDRRIRFLVLCVLVLAAGMAIEIFLIPHYLAAFTAAFYGIGLQAMRHLRLWSPEGQPIGMTLLRLTVMVCLAVAGLRLFAGPLHFRFPEWPASDWNFKWYGPGYFGTERAHIEAELSGLPGKQLAIVRYSPGHYSFDEWVYNAADIDGSKVIWARGMDAANDLELINYYKDRKVWLVQPDMQPTQISPYRMAEPEGATVR